MSEIDNLLTVIRKDWELIPNASKALAIVSILTVWLAMSAWQTEKSKDIAMLVILLLNVIVLFGLKVIKPRYLRRKYPLAAFLKKDLEVIQDGGIWFLIDHRKKQVRWIANMTTAIDLGFRISGKNILKEGQTTADYLVKSKPEAYKTGSHILITGSPGE